jgi:hypothetical protein
MSERRQVERVQRYTVVGIDCGDRAERVGITRNVSATGALFHSVSRFEVGDRVVLVMLPRGSEVEERVGARVVRAEVEPPDTDTSFPHLTAVEFDAPIELPDDPDDD